MECNNNTLNQPPIKMRKLLHPLPIKPKQSDMVVARQSNAEFRVRFRELSCEFSYNFQYANYRKFCLSC